jgi:hypothetical protein
MRPLLYITLLFALAFPVNAVADEVPVLLRAKKTEQADSMGCNFVEQTTKLVYDLIISGKIKLWDSPQKEIQITGTSLKEIEKTTATEFVTQDIIVIYEMWEVSKRRLNSRTLGFMFLNKDNRNADVSYGYVDYADIRDFFANTRVEANANGSYGRSMLWYLTRKNFNYTVIQFAGKLIESKQEMNETLAAYKGNLQFGDAFINDDDGVKMITYIIDVKSAMDSLMQANSKSIVKAFENYFEENTEEFYNLGGDRIPNVTKPNFKIKVTGIEVTESWKQMGEQIIYEPVSINISVSDSALTPIRKSELINMDIVVNEKKFILVLLEKQYNYIITQINSQKIARKEAYLYNKALGTYKWNQLMEYVKYY